MCRRRQKNREPSLNAPTRRRICAVQGCFLPRSEWTPTSPDSPSAQTFSLPPSMPTSADSKPQVSSFSFLAIESALLGWEEPGGTLVARQTKPDGCDFDDRFFQSGFLWSQSGEARRFFPIAALFVSHESRFTPSSRLAFGNNRLRTSAIFCLTDHQGERAE